MNIPYQELRHHSEYSLQTGCGRLADHVQRCVDLGFQGICLTETDSMRAVYQLNEECMNAGKQDPNTGEWERVKIRPMYGLEASICNDMLVKGLSKERVEQLRLEHPRPGALKKAVWAEERTLGLTKTSKLCLRAVDNDGLANLFKLSSAAWHEGHFIRPRLDMAEVFAHSKGLSASIGGVDGLTAEYINSGDYAGAIALVEQMVEAFQENFWLEIQPHANCEKVNKAHIMIAKHMGVPLIAVNDVHYTLEADTDAHEIILCLARHKNILDPDHPKSPAGYHVRTGEEMLEAFKQHGVSEDVALDAITRTVQVAELHQAVLHIDRKAAILPAIEHEYDGDDNEKLKQMCLEGWGWRKIDERAAKLGIDRKVYIQRLDKELSAIKRQKFPRYFLIVHDLIHWSRRNGIMTGPGRGSAAGSLVCYLTGITAIDPMEHKLMFERFISPARIDMPDIDMDFEDAKRQQVIDYLHERYGADKVSYICAFGRMKGKAALKDVSRVLCVPFNEVNAITGAIIERSSGDERASQTVSDSFQEFEVCRQFNERYPKILPLVEKLEGTLRQIGVHAAGIITSPIPLRDVIPIEKHTRKGEVVTITGMGMYGSESQGLVKLDVLGLRTLSVLSRAKEAIKERHGVDIDFEALELNDADVLNMFTKHDFVGIFQYDSTGARSACESVPFSSFEDVAALTALNRPGTMRSGLATEFKKRKLDPRKIKPFHPLVDAICDETLGILVYQEQVIRIFVEVAGYEPGTADSLRKKIAKKWGDEAIGREREIFIKGAVKNGVPEDDAAKLMDNITFFGSYGFNKSHASAYGAISYWGMWLKKYYPTEFMWSLMVNEPDRGEIARFAKEAKRLDIKVLPPDINSSGVEFSIDNDGNIRASLADVKNVGQTAIKAIVEAQPFGDIIDLLTRCSGRALNSRVLQSLIKAGAMKQILPNTRWALENMDDWLGLARKKRKGWQTLAKNNVIASRVEPDYSEEDALYLAAEVSPLGGGKHPIEIYRKLLDGPLSHISWLSIGSEDFWKNRHAYLRGALIEIRYNQVGDFHTTEPSDAEKEKIGWGKRYANVNLEDESGVQHRVKIDIDIFEEYRHIIDKGIGTCVCMKVSISHKYRHIKAHYMADLEDMRQKHRLNVKFDRWERCFIDHPAKAHSEPFPKAKYFSAIGLVTNLKTTYDRNGNQMAFFGIEDGHGGFLDVVVFASVYDFHGDSLKVGQVIEVALRRDKQSVFMADDGVTRLISG